MDEWYFGEYRVTHSCGGAYYVYEPGGDEPIATFVRRPDAKLFCIVKSLNEN